MKSRCSPFLRIPLLLFALIAGAAPAVHGFQQRREPSRFDPLAIPDPSATVGPASLPLDSLPAADPLRREWGSFLSFHGPGWRVVLDRRSGAPLLVEGQGIPWISPAGFLLGEGAEVPPSGGAATGGDGAEVTLATVETLERSLKGFLSRHVTLLKAADEELVLNRAASVPLTPEVWQVVFDRRVRGVPVAGERYIFTIGHGNLVSFGASRWSEAAAETIPTLGADEAMRRLYAYMGLDGTEGIEIVQGASLLLEPMDARGRADETAAGAGPYDGPVGGGYASVLAWRYALRVNGEPGTWVGLVQAGGPAAGRILALYDDNRYAQVKGGVYPVSDDQICPSGCEQANFPMPFADVKIGGGPTSISNTMGQFDCSPTSSNAATILAGQYVKVQDNCGAISESVTCDNDLDLRTSGGIDCTVPAGSSPGNTHASRAGFYHLNRIAEHGRAWLPANTWLTQQLTDNVNINATCNAYWNGVSVNFYKSGGGCNNTGEIAGVFLHEWGHGLDQNDGGGYDDPTEAYADITAVMSTHVSCVGRGFFQSGNCSGYGNPCLNCTGIRDQDWDQRVDHTPSTPSGFVQNHCGGGDSPCGKEGHCESYVGGETIWDLANRDLPPLGLDQNTAWQLTDKLWYKSRNGSGGNAYNCSLPSSDGCGSNSWFTKLRNIDDDDGNLNNGTPHASAIFAAFNRHGIACGAAGDPSNQNSSSCPPLPAPSLTAAAGSSSVSLSWTAVANAASYNVLRNDAGCSAGYTIIANVPSPGTSYTDSGLANGFTEYYTVQAVGANGACDGALSSCQAASPQPFAGSVSLDRSSYACSTTMAVTVRDANIGAPTTSILVTSTSEPSPEMLLLTETGPGSSTYTGAIVTEPASPTHDGKLQVQDGDLITASYHDSDNGNGQRAVAYTTARADCAGPKISAISVADQPPGRVQVSWTTDEKATSRVDYGPTGSLGSAVSDGGLVTSHSLFLSALNFCGTYFFKITSTDGQGNSSVADRGGLHYSFETGDVPGRVYFDNYEGSGGWTLNGEWQIDAAQGKGNPSGRDPAAAWSGGREMGTDLTGLGANPGDYEPNASITATSPTINCTTLHNGRLMFRRWLNVGANDVARMAVQSGLATTLVYTSPPSGNTESDWTLQSYDVSHAVDGKSSVQVVFSLVSDGAGQFGGWNVDDIVLKDGSLPDAKFCGGCANKPSFAGLTSAADASGCADTGITVSWNPAASWGSSGGGTYAVYRDTTPNFTPSASNRLVKGLAATSYTDSTAPNNTTLYYLARAENDETCSTGPNNNGVQDDNTVYLSARDELSQPVPADIGSSLRAARIADTNVRLTWSAVSGASSYHVYRGDSPQTSGTAGTTGGTVFEDAGEATHPPSRYYLVKGANTCGTEGP